MSSHHAQSHHSPERPPIDASPAAPDTAAKGQPGSTRWDSLVRRTQELTAPLSAKVFHYSPLPQGPCIRLLQIHPGNNADVIECSLRVANLDDNPRYTALSYSWTKDESFLYGPLLEMGKVAWNILSWRSNRTSRLWEPENAYRKDSGSKERTKTILCDKTRIEVYPNLYAALLQLRQSQRGEYWIDQVCINQKDAIEKGAQIQMMGQIYSSAKGVEVWLGACPSALSPWMSELQTSPPKRTVPDKGLSERPDLAITAMYLLTRRWFQRLWVVQETCLARDIRFLLGEHELSQQALTAAIEWIGIASTPDALSRHTFGFRRFWGYHLKQVPALLESRENFKNGQQWPLHQWLEMVKGRKATELKDYVYAGLALIQPGHLAIDTGLQLSEERPCTPRATRNIHESELKVQEKLPLTKRRLWPGLRADIDADATEVFLNLAACILSQPRGIDILTMSARFRDPKMLNNFRNQRADKTTGLLELPSWIPNPSSLSSRVLDPLKDLAASEFTACTHLPNSARISADGTTLYIDAAELGKIDLVVETPWYFQDAWKFLLKMEGTHGPSGQTYLKDLANALVLGPRNETFPTPDDTLRALVLCFYNDINATWESRKKSEERYHYNIPSAKSTRDREKLELDLRRLQEFMLQLETEYETLKSRYPDQEWPELGEALNDKDILLLQKYTGIRDRTRWWRTLFTTTSGYLGMGPPWLRAGDVVMLVKGGSVPYAFTHWDEERRRRLQWYERGEEGGRARRKRTKKYKAAIEECRNSIGEADAWILVGEAYVEGFMVGEAVDPDFKRIAVV